MNNQRHNVPKRETPNPRNASVELLRQQIAQIYDEPNSSNDQQAPPQSQPQKNSAPSPEQTNVYDKNYASVEPSAPPKQYDWQTYHSAWQDYYQQYYHRYYLQQIHNLRQQNKMITPTASKTPEPSVQHQKTPESTVVTGVNTDLPPEPPKTRVDEIKRDLRKKISSRGERIKKSPHFKPILAALIVGALFLATQFEQTIIAKIQYYVSPGTAANESSKIIVDPTIAANVGEESKVIIPKINVEAPIINVDSYNEAEIQEALDKGVVHYANTALPGEVGNDVILGHSSHTVFNQGKYKFVFILLDRLEDGDTVIQHYEGKRYVYKVFNKQVIEPTDFSLINIDTDKPVLTLITCTPPGTALKRLVVQAEQISPDPTNAPASKEPTISEGSLPATDQAPSLTERIGDLF